MKFRCFQSTIALVLLTAGLASAAGYNRQAAELHGSPSTISTERMMDHDLVGYGSYPTSYVRGFSAHRFAIDCCAESSPCQNLWDGYCGSHHQRHAHHDQCGCRRGFGHGLFQRRCHKCHRPLLSWLRGLRHRGCHKTCDCGHAVEGCSTCGNQPAPATSYGPEMLEMELQPVPDLGPPPELPRDDQEAEELESVRSFLPKRLRNLSMLNL